MAVIALIFGGTLGFIAGLSALAFGASLSAALAIWMGFGLLSAAGIMVFATLPSQSKPLSAQAQKA